MKKAIIFVLAALTFTGCKSDEAESVLNDFDNPKLTISLGSNNLTFEDPSIYYWNFNKPSNPYQNSTIYISGSEDNSEVFILFDAKKLTQQVSSVKVSGQDTVLGVQISTYFNNIPEIWYNDYFNDKANQSVEITDFEYRDKGRIKGVINTTMIGQSGTNKGKRINVKINFVGRYIAD
jgi:hypothetical protein